MTRLSKKRSKKPGSSPGTITLVGDQKAERARLSYIRYDDKSVEERDPTDLEECLRGKESPGVKWINLDGLHELDLIKQIGKSFSIHPLVLEDIVNTDQRPKLESYDHYLFLTLKMFHLRNEKGGQLSIESEQISFVLGESYVLSFQERTGDVFEQVRHRIRTGGTGQIRKRGGDYLLYALVDAIIDHYFLALEVLGEEIESVDEELAGKASAGTLQRIHELKKKIVFLRKSAWPLREMVSFMFRAESRLIRHTTTVFFRDVYDHVVQVLENIDGFREMVTSMTELYQSTIGNRMNEVMKVLTIIATIFIPPTFVAGVYGMNFDNMPELHSRYGYFVVLGLMVGLIVTLLALFKRKRWL